MGRGDDGNDDDLMDGEEDDEDLADDGDPNEDEDIGNNIS